MKAPADLLFKHAATRYLFALATVAIALVLRLLLSPLTGHGAPFVIFFGAVLVTSLFLGSGPGLFSLAVSLPLAAYAFVVRAGSPVSQAVFQALLYAVDGLIIVYVSVLANRRRRTLNDANRELQKLSDEAARS